MNAPGAAAHPRTPYGPLAVALAVYACVSVIVIRAAIHRTGGTLIYPLDDTYIHMGLARNLAMHGTWGTSAGQFVSASSSILWTLLLALSFLIGGVHAWIPLALDLVCGAVLLVVVDAILRRRLPAQTSWFRAGSLVVLVGLVPLASIALTGMEHLLHALLFVALVDSASRRIEEPDQPLVRVCTLAALTCATRYEGLFAVAALAALSLSRRRPRDAAALIISALAPLIVFGAYCLAHGAYPVPNSLLLKGSIPGFAFQPGNTPFRPTFLLYRSHLMDLALVFVSAVALIALQGREIRHADTTPVFALIVVSALQITFAQVGWLFRYEAYLLAGAACFLPPLLWQHASASTRPARRAVIVLLALCLLVPTVRRSIVSMRIVPQVAEDRFLEHRQIARFVAEHYDRDTVVINDLGMFSFFTDARLLDLFGLGSDEPIRLRRAPGGYTAERVDQWAHAEHARIAILQIDWIEITPRIPTTWTPVAQLILPRNLQFQTLRVGFYAIDPSEAERLRLSLERFARTLPPGPRMEFFGATS